MTRRDGRVTGSKRSREVSPREREFDPDPTTPNGQWAWHLLYCMGSTSAEQLGKALGKNKSSVYHWLNGRNVPKLEVWEEIARALRLPNPSWQSLVPSSEFVRYVKRYKRLPQK